MCCAEYLERLFVPRNDSRSRGFRTSYHPKSLGTFLAPFLIIAVTRTLESPVDP